MAQAISQSWQEWLHLHDLYVRYFAALDDREGDRQWVECFAEDGVLENPPAGVLGAGRGALAQWVRTYHQSWRPDEQRRHVFTNLALDVQEDSAAGSCYLTAFHCQAGKAMIGVVGYYSDRIIKIGGVWQFSHRLVVVDGQG